MKQALAITMLLMLAAVFVSADPQATEKAEAAFAERALKAHEAAADTHLALARWCFKQGMNVDGHAQGQRALALVPQHEKTLRELGYRKRRVDGHDTWELDPKRAPPAADAEGIKQDTRRKYRDERDKAYKAIAVEYVKLGRYADSVDLPAHARAANELAVGYDPLNETALAGAGWAKDENGDWLSPAESRERAATAEALAAAPEAAPVKTLPEWAPQVFDNKGKAVKVGSFTVIGSGDNLAEFGKYAHAAATISKGLLGGEHAETRLVVTLGKIEHEAYCTARHPGVPAFKDHKWIAAEHEAEVLNAEDERTSLERAVYAIALLEVRRRCGEAQFPWFEVAFAGNLTRRLLGRVSVVEFSGEGRGPSEPGRWKRTLQMQVAEEQQPELGKALVSRAPDEGQTILLHFFVRYLCQARAAALPAFCGAYRQEHDVEAAMKAAWDQDSTQMEAAFLEWFKS
jgi:hypothetical protein